MKPLPKINTWYAVNAELVLGDLLAGRLVLHHCRPAHRATLIAMLHTIASTALHDLITAGELDRDRDLLGQCDEAARFVELPPSTEPAS